MIDHLDNKKVPWSQFETYLKVHKVSIKSFKDLEKNKIMKAVDIEASLPASFLKLYEEIKKILKDNDILTSEEEKTNDL
jgi:hypothetical protein